MAQAFDRLGAPTAVIVEGDFGSDPTAILGTDVAPAQAEQTLEELERNAIEQPFWIVGVGGAEIDGDASLIAVYLFRNEDAAADSVDSIENLWSDATLGSGRRPVDEIVDLDSVTAEGSVVTVVAWPLEGRSTQIAFDCLFTRDVMFQHR